MATSLIAACAPEAPLVTIPPVEPGVVSAAAPDTVGPMRFDGDRMLDAHGRTVLLRGMNSVAKSAPFVSTDAAGSLGPDEMTYLRNSGFNAIRLGVAFSALVPTPGEVDQDYVDLVLDTVERLGDAGLWVQLDFHQDVFHLMPEWATPPDAVDLSDEPPEILSFIGWAAAYMSDQSLRQWNSFVSGEPIIDGRSVASVLGDAAAALVAQVDSDHVIGVDLLNEPFPGDTVFDCIFSGCAARDAQLSERYAEMAAPILAVDPDMALWLEPFAPTGYIAQPTMPRPQVDVAGQQPAQLGMAWHLYCHHTDGGVPEVADDLTRNFCEARMRNGFEAGERLARQLGGPMLLNEFGASRNPLDVSIVTRTADERFVSWMYWHLSPATSPTDSGIEDTVEAHIIRPYPQATAGDPVSLSYSPISGEFTYRYRPDAGVGAPTSIAVPARAYPRGYTVQVENATVISAANHGRLGVEADGSGATVTVRISRN